MNSSSRLALGGLAVVLLLMSGCQRINLERTVKVTGGTVGGMHVSAPRYKQKVKVEVTSPDGPLDVYLVIVKDADLPDDQMERLITDNAKGEVLDKKPNVKEATLEGTIPAGTPFAVVLSNRRGEDKTATVKITGQ